MGRIADMAASLGLRVKSPATFGTAPWPTDGRSGAVAGGPEVVYGSDATSTANIVDGMSAGELYRTQPHLRTVVSFVARNGAQLGRHVYTRAANDDRERVRGGVLADLMERPNDYMTGYQLFNNLFSELALYDFALWVPVYRDGRWQVDPIPGAWVQGVERSGPYQIKRYKIVPTNSGLGLWYFVDAADAVVFSGYGPAGSPFGSSPVVSLKHVLAEQINAYEFRSQMWRKGGRVGTFLSRPKDAPWSADAKKRFMDMWRSGFSGNGANAGSTPLLEDGMELKSVRFTAKEEQWLEAATLSLSTVAGAYHVPPSMVGVQGSTSSFASVKEFRKMLYTETLGPLIAQVEATINNRLAPLVAAPAGQYLELNISEKLQGDFEEQAAVMQAAVGGPYMTAAEARKRLNLPYLPGTDELLAPLNMGAAGNNGPAASEPLEPGAPDETPPKARGASHGARADGGARPVKAPSALEDDLEAFFKAQRAEVLRAIGSKAPSWWDEKRWNRELSATLQPHLLRESAKRARAVASAKGAPAADYSVARTEKFLKSVADSRADLVNATTREHYESALEAEDGDPESVYEDSKSRAGVVAATVMTFVAGFAAVEAVKQLAPGKGTKTWVSSGLPDSRHSDMDGETVGIDEKFSNGADWPGDPVLGAGEVANCMCGVDVDFN